MLHILYSRSPTWAPLEFTLHNVLLLKNEMDENLRFKQLKSWWITLYHNENIDIVICSKMYFVFRDTLALLAYFFKVPFVLLRSLSLSRTNSFLSRLVLSMLFGDTSWKNVCRIHLSSLSTVITILLIFSFNFFVPAKEYESPWQIPDTFLKRVFWVAMIPMHAVFFVTIPDCRRPGRWHRTYPVTFVMSIAWIAGLSYIMVWMVTVAGKCSHQSDPFRPFQKCCNCLGLVCRARKNISSQLQLLVSFRQSSQNTFKHYLHFAG